MNDKIKILYIDDYSLDRELVKDALEKEHGGFEVAEAANRQEFETLLNTRKFDAVLSDFNIAGFEGLQVLAAVHAAHPDLPVIIVTGTGSEEIAVKALKLGASDYVIKRPKHIQKLPQTILSAMEKQQLKDQQRQAKLALMESEERYRKILENALMGVYQVTLGGKILFANQKMVDMFGYGSCEELQAHSILELYARPEERAVVIKEIMETGFIINEFEFRRKDGKSVWIRLHMQKSTTKEGKIIIDGLIEDVTDFKKMEAQFQQAQKLEAIGTLSGGIAHDFNNILSSVIGFTELSMEDAEPGSPIHDNLTEVLVAGKRAKDLVKQIMSFSRRDEQEKKPLQLNPLVREAARMLRSTISSNIKITEHICETMLVITANPSQLNQVLLNLITNAAHAVDENGLIEIGIDTVTFDEDIIDQYPDCLPGAYAKIFVRDNGCGIEKETLPLIFDPYFTTKAPDKGTGLGLSVVHGIVKLHNGHITVYSEPGRGTIFRVYLPLASQLPSSESTRTTAPLPGGSEHILMVDDEPAIVNIQQQILERLGYTITSHTQSMEALNAFQAAPDSFDLIITDMTMPNMNGDRLILSIKEIRPDTPVILCTGFSEKINAKTSKDMLIDGFLMKPANRKEMATIVRNVLDAARKNDPNAAFLP